MDRVFSVNVGSTPMSMPASLQRGYVQDGVAFTKVGPWWFHTVTEELVNAQVALGQTADSSKTNQLATGLTAALGQRIPRTGDTGLVGDYTTTGTWTGTFSLNLANAYFTVDVANNKVIQNLDANCYMQYVRGSNLWQQIIDGKTCTTLTKNAIDLPGQVTAQGNDATSAYQGFSGRSSMVLGSVVQTYFDARHTNNVPYASVGLQAFANGSSQILLYATAPGANGTDRRALVGFADTSDGLQRLNDAVTANGIPRLGQIQSLTATTQLGIGQTWQSFTSGQRQAGVNYYNLTAKPIVVAANLGLSGSVVTMYVNGTTVAQSVGANTSLLVTVVSPGGYVSVSGYSAFSFWAELR